MSPIAAYVLALSLCVIAAITVLTISSMKEKKQKLEKERQRRLIEEKSTHFLDSRDIDSVCDICFGEIENGDVAACSCGRTFHIECFGMTGECPYCEGKEDAVSVRPARVPVCPACGKELEGNVCSCGTVLPNRDGTFACVCGSGICVDDGECPYCGAVYGTKYSQSN